MLADISVVDRIYIITGRTDMRKSIDGLCAIIKDLMDEDQPDGRSLYLFCGRRCDRIKAILKEKNIDSKKFPERDLQSSISKAKNNMTTAEQYANSANDFYTRITAEVYRAYEARLQKNNALDFDDLLLKTIFLFRENEEALHYYQRRFAYILVDEYQDTNQVQFKLLEMLANHPNEYGETEHNLCVVGDDDQSIYRFRGANIYNILNFEDQYPDAEVIKLEQNYRSTGTILEAANEVIANNQERKKKALWTDSGSGAPITVTAYPDNYREAEGIIETITALARTEGKEYKDFAILYRTNAQSRVIEEKCIFSGVPYKVVGGVNFYSRREIKDVLAYLKTIDNGEDDLAVTRILNVPRRGIGAATVAKLQDFAVVNNLTFLEALGRAPYVQGVARSAGKIAVFTDLIRMYREKLDEPGVSLTSWTKELLEDSGYMAELESEGSEEAEARLENIEELLNKMTDFEVRGGIWIETDETDQAGIRLAAPDLRQASGREMLSAFLQEVSLVADIDNMDSEKNAVLLMTLHSAKGLEFPVVFLAGMEEGIFPGYMSINSGDEHEIEEERRLCYVGITRAKERLFLSHAMRRMQHGNEMMNPPSRFLQEIPRYLITESGTLRTPRYQRRDSIFRAEPARTAAGREATVKRETAGGRQGDLFAGNPLISKGFGGRTATAGAGASGAAPAYDLHFEAGDRVKHPKFGTGTVNEAKSGTGGAEVTVLFDDEQIGVRKMKVAFAKLVKI